MATNVLERSGGARHRSREQLAHAPSARAPFNIVEAKLHVPDVRPDTVSRPGLVNRLRATRSVPVVSLVAPAGYGKTTLLAQWAAREKRPLAWVSLDEGDEDPVVLLRHIAAAVDRVEPLDPAVIAALYSPGLPFSPSVVSGLGAALAAVDEPVVLVLDDAHLLGSGDAIGAVAALVDHVPAGSLLVLTGRVSPKVPLARLRARGRLLELGTDELALTRREATRLLGNIGVELTDAEITELVGQTEGWAAALYLAALTLRDRDTDGASNESRVFSGDDRFLADYFHSEYLGGLKIKHLAFLRRTSVLERMCGALCDAVLERDDSTRELASLERSNLFLVPLDHQREWYRYHHLFRDLLRRELAEREPDVVQVLHSRAADWFETHGDPESALDHAQAAGDRDRAAEILGSIALPVYHSGRIATVERWLAGFDDEGQLERFPAIALHGSRVHSERGRPVEAERWLAAAERSETRRPLPDGSSSARPWIAVLRAAMCRNGAEEMLSDAESALAELPGTSSWRPQAILLEGVAHVLLGNNGRGDAILGQAVEAAERLGSTESRDVALSERSLLAAARGDHDASERLALQAHALAEELELETCSTRAIELAASARVLLRAGRWDQARVRLDDALRLVPLLTHALPWLAVQTRLELARTSIALRDVGRARALLGEIEEILRRRPKLGVLCEQARALRAELAAIPEGAGSRRQVLSDAELRILPLLATHLKFAEIGERFDLSRNTIKTQAMSVYRKLDVSSRSEAIERAVQLGLLRKVA